MTDQDLSPLETIIIDVLMSNHGAVKSFEGLATSVVIFQSCNLGEKEDLRITPGSVRSALGKMDEKGIITRNVDSDRKATYVISLPDDHESNQGGTLWTLEDIHDLTGKRMNSRGGGEDVVPELDPNGEDSLDVFTTNASSVESILPDYETLFDMIGQRIDADRTEREALEARNEELETSLQAVREQNQELVAQLENLRERVSSVLSDFGSTAS